MGASTEPLLSSEDPKSAATANVPEAALALAKTCIGTGVMALPYAFLQGGILSVPGMVLLGLWNWGTALQLLQVRAAIAESMPIVGAPEAKAGYSAVVQVALGHRGVTILEWSLAVTLVIVCTSMQIQAGQLLSACTGLPYWLSAVSSAAVLVPLILQRSLRGIAAIAAIALLFLFVGLFAVAASGISEYGLFPSLSGRLRSVPSLRGCAIFFGVSSFSFGLHTTLLPVQDGMRAPKRAKEAVHASILCVVAFYLAVGLYLAALFSQSDDGVQQIILLNLPTPSGLATAVQGSCALVALLSYPLPCMPVLQMAEAALGVPTAPASTPAAHAALQTARRKQGTWVRLGTLGTTTIGALTLQKFSTAAGLAGSLTIVASLVLPPLCHLRVCAWPPDHARRHLGLAFGDFVLVVLGSAAALWCFAYTLQDIQQQQT